MNIRAVVKEDRGNFSVVIEGFETPRDTYQFGQHLNREVCEQIARLVNNALSEYED